MIYVVTATSYNGADGSETVYVNSVYGSEARAEAFCARMNEGRGSYGTFYQVEETEYFA